MLDIDPTILAMPVFAFFIGSEAAFDAVKKTNEYEKKDTFTNLGIGVISMLWSGLFAVGYVYIYEISYRISPIKLESVWWVWVLALILGDLSYYWFHRISHESRLLWNIHVAHHSSEHYNFSVALRQPWFGAAVIWVFLLPLAFLGFSPFIIVTSYGINLIYQFFIHTKFVPKLGFLEYFLNTPSHHRVHHGVNTEYLDKNYGGILIIWDRLFNTFVEEQEVPRYGVIKPIKSFNWVWINAHGWVEMWDAMKTKQSLFGKLRCIFGSPAMDFIEDKKR